MQRKENKNVDEFGKRGAELPNYSEYEPEAEQNASAGLINPQNAEENPEDGRASPRTSVKKKAKVHFNPVVGMVAALATVVVGASVLPKIAPKVVEEKSCVVGKEFCAYDLNIENPDQIPLKLVVFNDYFAEESDVVSGNVKGVVNGLSANTSYKIAVKGSLGFGTKTFYSTQFTTLNDDSKFKASVTANYYIIEGDNLLFYKVTIKDLLGYYSNFKVFVEINGYLKPTEIVGSIQEEQHIPLKNIRAPYFVLRITADTKDPVDTANGITNTTVFSATVKNEGAQQI